MIILCFLLLFSCSSINFFNNSSKRHIEKDYYINGNIKYKIQKINEEIDGYAKYWTEDGILINEVYYINGILNGKWKEYYLNGNLKYSVNYLYGIKDGYELWFYENGIKKSELFYDNGEIVGTKIRWSKAGELIKK